MSGLLSLVATPIGNLEDVTLRALRTLREADRVLAEDTRRTLGLLRHHGISAKLTSLHAHTKPAQVEALAEQLAQGARFALVTDAGTPLVSDPGHALLEAAIQRGVPVEAIPGASAVLTALCVAGIHCDRFRFVGFLPRSGTRRQRALSQIAGDPDTTVLFESPHRAHRTLVELRDACGAERSAAVCRELTKLHEQVARESLGALCDQFAGPTKGEFTIVIEGREATLAKEPPTLSLEEALEQVQEADREAPLSTREAARRLAALSGLDRREAYKLMVDQRSRQTRG